MSIDAYIDRLIVREGGYSNHPDDSGGETMWGITSAVAHEFGYIGPMKIMPREVAAQIYLQRYWIKPQLDKINAIAPTVAEKLFDIGVNAGLTTGMRFLQRALNVLNRQDQDYPDVSVDGLFGEKTMRALKALLGVRGDSGHKVLVSMINAQLSVYYIELAERHPKNETFQYGWQLNRVLAV